MNIERWVRTRKEAWGRLEQLVASIERKGMRSLRRGQLQELGRLYKAASADLSRARALNLSGQVPSYLNNLVVRAHNQVYQRRQNRWMDLARFLWILFPRLVRQNLVYLALSTALFIIPTVAAFAITLADPEFGHLEFLPGQQIVSEATWDCIEHGRSWTDELQKDSPSGSTMIATNNIKVCIFSFALGTTFGIGTVAILLMNGLMLGMVVAGCYAHGILKYNLCFMSGHAPLELTAIFVSGAAGLLIGKGMLFPGRVSRVDSFREAGKPAMQLFAGCIPLLAIAGTIEGYISPRTDMHCDIKIWVGITTWIAVLAYLFVPREGKVATVVESSAPR